MSEKFSDGGAEECKEVRRVISTTSGWVEQMEDRHGVVEPGPYDVITGNDIELAMQEVRNAFAAKPQSCNMTSHLGHYECQACGFDVSIL